MGIPINIVYPFLISYPQKHILQYLWHRTLLNILSLKTFLKNNNVYGVPIIVVFQVKIWFYIAFISFQLFQQPTPQFQCISYV